MGIVITLSFTALMLILLSVIVRRRRRIASGWNPQRAVSDRIAAFRMRWRNR